jgi:hypothetical protein
MGISSRFEQVQANARMVWRSVEGDLSEAFIRLGMCKSDLHNYEDVRFWIEVEREIVDMARREGFFGQTLQNGNEK